MPTPKIFMECPLQCQTPPPLKARCEDKVSGGSSPYRSLNGLPASPEGASIFADSKNLERKVTTVIGKLQSLSQANSPCEVRSACSGFSECIASSPELKPSWDMFGRRAHALADRSSNLVADRFDALKLPIGKMYGKELCLQLKLMLLQAQVGDLEDIPANIRVVSYRTLRAIGADYAVPKAMVRTVHVYWGCTGSGKSHRAHLESRDPYPKDPRSKFWSGYQGQKDVIIDEFRGGIDVAHLLRWFDRYPVHVEIKGSSRPLEASTYWVTSNLHPKDWFPELDQPTLDALLRRLDIVEMNDPWTEDDVL